MADVWRAAVSSGDVAKLSELLVSAAGSPDAALSVVNSCAEVLLLKKQSGVLCDASSLTGESYTVGVHRGVSVPFWWRQGGRSMAYKVIALDEEQSATILLL